MSSLGKRSLCFHPLQGFFSELGVTRDGRAFPSRRDVHAAEMSGADEFDDDKKEVSAEVYEMDAFLGSTIELRALPSAFVGDPGEEIHGDSRGTFRLAKQVSAIYVAPESNCCFSTRDLCKILEDFSPPAYEEEMDDDCKDASGHYDILQSLTHVPGTEFTYEVKWIRDPHLDLATRDATRDAARDTKARAAHAIKEANPATRGLGAIGKPGACAGNCGYWAAANSNYCSSCIAVGQQPSGSSDNPACPKCGKDFSVLGPTSVSRHLAKCDGGM